MKTFMVFFLSFALSFGLFAQTRSSLHSKEFNSKALDLVEKGVKAMEKGNMAKAKKQFNKALEESEKTFHAHGYLAVIAEKENKIPESLKLFDKAFEVFGEYKSHLIERKTDYLKEMERQMISDQNMINRRTSNYADNSSDNPAEMQSSATERKNRVKKLKEQLEETKNMTYPAFFYFKHGNALMKSKQVDKALEKYEAAVESDPEFKDTYANLAVVYFMAQDCEKAKATFKKGQELGTEFHPAFEKDLKARCQ